MKEKNISLNLERIAELSNILNSVSISRRLNIPKNDIYRGYSQEVRILDCKEEYEHSFFERMKARVDLYKIYFKSKDVLVKQSAQKALKGFGFFISLYNFCSLNGGKR